MVDDLAGVFQWLLYNTVQIDEKSWRRFIISDQVNVFPVVWWQAFQLFLAHTHSLSLVSTPIVYNYLNRKIQKIPPSLIQKREDICFNAYILLKGSLNYCIFVAFTLHIYI